MLIGATGRLAGDGDRLLGAHGAARVRHVARSEGALVASLPWGVATLDAGERWASDAHGGRLVYSGQILPPGGTLRGATPGATASALLADLAARGLRALDDYDGSFALAWWDARAGRLHLARDRFGIEPLYYATLGTSVLFGSRLRDLRATGLLPGGLSGQGLAEFLAYGWVPGTATLDEAVCRLAPGGCAEIDPARGLVSLGRWYRLSFAHPLPADERAIADGFRERLERAVVRRLGEPPFGVLLSGGMDSSSALTFARRHEPGRIHTYAFRCPGQAFDESHYARALAAELGTEHTEVEYGEREALLQEELAAEMEVPFCNIGINIGTWLLGRAAGRDVSVVLTGDGGDELWGSHPVYAAQRLMRWYDRLPMPGALRRAVLRATQNIPDSDAKRDLRVKLKRILPAEGLPAALAHWRWRALYVRGDFDRLLTPEAAALVRSADPFKPVLDAFAGYDGPDDGLSAMLYNDYFSESAYYFDRLLLLRRFGVEARSPFYDRELVEYGARIPASLKLEGIERTKRLFRVAMEGVLPDVINHRRDKLGHSVPLKNWLRTDGVLGRRVGELLAPEALERRGIFRPDAVAALAEEHRARRHNHSHRLWSIATLEGWLRRLEGAPAEAAEPEARRAWA
jgi:asparagine synthase (glutamine-hydrolysing)